MRPPSDLFRRLPTVNDLLENPQIKSLVERVNQMEVTAGVRQFVDRLRREVSRRRLDMPLPSIGELADRARRFILGKRAAGLPRVVNATGDLWPAGMSGPPLAEEAVAAVTDLMQHYHAQGDQEVAEAIADFAGAEAAMVVNSANAALWLALAAMADGKPVVVARGELGTLDGDVRLTDVAAQGGVQLVEVGATNSTTLADYEQALVAGAGLVLRIESVPYAVATECTRPTVAELVAAAAAHSVPMLHHLGRGSLAPLDDEIDIDVPDAGKSLAAGSSLVVLRGDGYLGGPDCGLVVGKRTMIARLRNHPLAKIVGAVALVEGALGATLAAHRQPDRRAMAIPLISLLTTPLDNLQIRAARLASQIADKQGIASAEPIALPPGGTSGTARPLASFGIAIDCEPEATRRIAQQLEESHPRVVGHWNENRLVLDLRSVFPDEDIPLVSAFDEPDAATGQDSPPSTTTNQH